MLKEPTMEIFIMAIKQRVLYGITALKSWVDSTFLKKTDADKFITAPEVTSILNTSAIGFPDWTKVSTLTTATTYTAPTNGYLIVGTKGGNGNRWIDVAINGANYRFNGDNGAYQYGWGCMQLTLPMSKGTKYQFSVSQKLAFAYFLGC